MHLGRSSPRDGRVRVPLHSSTSAHGVDGRYAVVRPIGPGGMGRVVEIERISDRCALALKYCDGSPLGRKRLVREAKILSGLDHPHLLPVLDANLEHDPALFRHAAGGRHAGSPSSQMRGDAGLGHPRLPPDLAGVQGLHEPASCIATSSRPISSGWATDATCVADLGLATRASATRRSSPATLAILGTLNYLAPRAIDAGRQPPGRLRGPTSSSSARSSTRWPRDDLRP